ncbi:MAG: hydrogenase small subunit [Deltaproteobacteria bacterium]|nr:hydrogenase small subunit [Deltaproteobacteria bacterium]
MKCCDSNHCDFTQESIAGGVSRRDFIKVCSAAAVYMGLSESFGPTIAEAATTAAKRPPVIWLSGQECTGCTESLLRTSHPTIGTLLLDLISLDYSETLNTGAGHQAEEFRAKSIEENKGKFILVCEGSIPVKDGGIYCKVAGRTALEILKETAPKAAAVISFGSCAAWGGVPAADPNPTGATPVYKILEGTGIPVINIPGCPPNPYNFLSTVLYYVTFKKLPELDDKLRPKFAYGRLIHENCERRPHFDAGRFAEKFGDEGHRKGYCLYKLGCKGPETYNNCSTLRFNDVGTWPVNTGHPCFGCSEEGVGFHAPLYSPAQVLNVTPPAQFVSAQPEKGKGASALAAAVAGAAIGAGAVAIGSNMGKKDQDNEES